MAIELSTTNKSCILKQRHLAGLHHHLTHHLQTLPTNTAGSIPVRTSALYSRLRLPEEFKCLYCGSKAATRTLLPVKHSSSGIATRSPQLYHLQPHPLLSIVELGVTCLPHSSSHFLSNCKADLLCLYNDRNHFVCGVSCSVIQAQNCQAVYLQGVCFGKTQHVKP
ncbi:hypothetical protein GBAR_LOCUS30091 [Geodia barretti]|uniref:Uncharacterized protein n=1 Tax=Geodia barretti TaxID=519541 RepID=A0AA35TV92_GEOBA|nr:hypothetical protein GBAR_LOCUS30091 [Geodia barretti]